MGHGAEAGWGGEGGAALLDGFGKGGRPSHSRRSLAGCRGSPRVDLAEVAAVWCGGAQVRVWAVDTSPEAARWAALNVEREQLGGTVRVVLGSWCAPPAPAPFPASHAAPGRCLTSC